MNLNKILGYLLLICGLILIVFTLYQSYNIFTGKSLAPSVFKIQMAKKLQANSNLNLQQQIEQQINEAVSQQIAGMLPIGEVNKLLDLISWSILAGILIFGGGQIASLGIRLIM